MTYKERWNLIFHKNECLQVVLYNETKRASIKIIRVDFNFDKFDLGECSYSIDNERIYLMGGLPTLTYYINNPIPIEPRDSRAVEFTSSLFQKVVKLKVVEDIAKIKNEEGTPLKTVLIICTVVILAGIGISTYLIMGGIDDITLMNEEYQNIIEIIKERLLSGDLNG